TVSSRPCFAGVSAQSFLHCFTLGSVAFNLQVGHSGGARYHAVLIPNCPGAPVDLANSGYLARILQHFSAESSGCLPPGPGVARGARGGGRDALRGRDRDHTHQPSRRRRKRRRREVKLAKPQPLALPGKLRRGADFSPCPGECPFVHLVVFIRHLLCAEH
uniref:Uncharacterized protein n=1 Tax=Ornithorhynchus anatinus TaxID=9258 RepID=A0A6I8P7L1_ORNAN